MDMCILYNYLISAPHNKRNLRLAAIIRSAFFTKMVLHPLGNCFVKGKIDSNTKYDEETKSVYMYRTFSQTTYLLYLVAQCSSRLLEFQWVLTVLPSCQICSYILMKSNSIRSYTTVLQTKDSSHVHQFHIWVVDVCSRGFHKDS